MDGLNDSASEERLLPLLRPRRVHHLRPHRWLRDRWIVRNLSEGFFVVGFVVFLLFTGALVSLVDADARWQILFIGAAGTVVASLWFSLATSVSAEQMAARNALSLERSLVEADLQGVALSHAYLRRRELGWAKLSNADLRHVDATEANFTEARLTEALCNGATLDQATMACVGLHRVRLNRARLRGTVLTAATGSQASMIASDLRDAVLDESALFDARLRRARLDGASLRGVRWPLADLRGASLRGADLASADLSRADLRWADLSGVDLSTAVLAEADLRFARIDVPQWEVAHRLGARLSANIVEHLDLPTSVVPACVELPERVISSGSAAQKQMVPRLLMRVLTAGLAFGAAAVGLILLPPDELLGEPGESVGVLGSTTERYDVILGGEGDVTVIVDGVPLQWSSPSENSGVAVSSSLVVQVRGAGIVSCELRATGETVDAELASGAAECVAVP